MAVDRYTRCILTCIFGLTQLVNLITCDLIDVKLGLNISFDPTEVDQLPQEEVTTVNLGYFLESNRTVSLSLKCQQPHIADIHGPREITLYPTASSVYHFNGSFEVQGLFLGRTKVVFSISENGTNSTDSNSGFNLTGQKVSDTFYELRDTYDVTVIREDGPLNTAFLVSVIILVVLANTAMGCKVDLAIVKEILKKPLAPAVGLFSQFIIMPLLGLAASFAFTFEPGIALGLFATGCAPGGGASNAYTYLLGGDVSLSVTMTLVSTLASFGLIPLWLLTVGTRVLYKKEGVRIPYENIFTSLAGLILPVLIGLLIQWKRPRWTKYILKAVTPLMIITVIVILSVGIYANLYIFKLLQPEVLVAGAILPNCGFILGGVAGLISRQPWNRVKTIAIETGLQNTGIPIVLLQVSLPKPDSDFAIVAPIASAIFTPILLWIWILVRVIRKKCFKKSQSLENKEAHSDHIDLHSPCTDGETLPESPGGSPTNRL